MTAFALAAALVLSLPSLRLGLVLDDLWHRAKMLGGSPLQRQPTGARTLFEFVSGSPEDYRTMLETGFTPWWVAPNLRISFFRPLSCVTHALDYALWPTTPALMHLHSVLWYLALLAVAARLYRRILPPLAANIAVLFYALDPTHALPVGWVANRNALVAATFALGALALWDARRNLLAGVALAAALASGESGVAILGFLAAHWLVLDRRPLREAAPLALAFGAWVVAYRAGHHGVVGSGIYTDPARAPFAYAQSVAAHLPVLLASELGAPAPDPFPLIPLAAKVALFVVALVFLGWTASAARRIEPVHQRTARFLALGSVLATLPGSATFPSGRLLLLPGFGLVGLVALVCAAPLASRGERAFRAWMWGKHALFAPLLYVAGLHDMVLVDRVIRTVGRGVPVDGSAADKRLVIVNAPDTAFAYYTLTHPLEAGLPAPKRLLIASGNRRDVRLTRTGVASFTVRQDGGLYRDGTEILFRDPHLPFAVGDHIEQSDAHITITHVLPDGVPDEVTIELTRDLTQAYVLRAWEGSTLVPFTLPPLGESVTFPGRLPPLW